MKTMKNILKRNKAYPLIVFLLITVGGISGTSIASKLSKDIPRDNLESTMDTKAWTLLFYDDADCTNMFNPLQSFATDAYSGVNLTTIVLEDQEKGPAKYWRVQENHTTIFLEDLGEVNMGDPATLQNFITYGKEHFPADRYFLAVYDHGGAWMGSCWDINSRNDHLTMDELQQALQDAGGVDIICFTAPCSMGSLEAVYELRDVVDVYIGSEELSGYMYWEGGTVRDVCDLLNNETGQSTNEIGEQIIQFISKHNPNKPDLTMSAIRTDKITDVVNAVNILSKDLLKKWFRSSYKNVKTAHDNTFKLDKEYDDELYDLYNFTQNLEGVSAAQTVQTALTQAVIAECHGKTHNGCHGLSIYFPGKIMKSHSTLLYGKQSYGLDFTRDTFWNEFLGIYVFTNSIFG